LRRLVKLKAEWTAKERERSQRLDFLGYQIAEIEKADLKPGEEDELRARRNILKNAEKISSLIDRALDLAYSGDAAIAGRLAGLEHAISEIASIDASFAEWSAALGPFSIVVGELADALVKYKDKQDMTADSPEAVEERLSLIESFKRKYGGDIKDIQAYLASLKTESQDLARIQDKLAQVEKDIGRTFVAYASRARTLSGRRKDAARDLEDRIEKEIGLLGMKKARFHIRVEGAPVETPEKAKDAGIDDVEFLISPNPGEELKPLRRIASGGELSRIMLALKAVGKESSGAKTLIFDEIDAGIGGKTAEFIAQKLRSLARTHQIICITHLPQIASFADQHFKIEKSVEKNRTYTTVKKLSFEERVDEVARLMSGSRITDAALESARDMIRHNAGTGKAGLG
jgi:DNA repair protein RecN (Recombination protein N)